MDQLGRGGGILKRVFFFLFSFLLSLFSLLFRSTNEDLFETVARNRHSRLIDIRLIFSLFFDFFLQTFTSFVDSSTKQIRLSVETSEYIPPPTTLQFCLFAFSPSNVTNRITLLPSPSLEFTAASASFLFIFSIPCRRSFLPFPSSHLHPLSRRSSAIAFLSFPTPQSTFHIFCFLGYYQQCLLANLSLSCSPFLYLFFPLT